VEQRQRQCGGAPCAAAADTRHCQQRSPAAAAAAAGVSTSCGPLLLPWWTDCVTYRMPLMAAAAARLPPTHFI